MSVRDPEDKKLLEDCFAQDKQAWDTFVERYSRLISSAIVKTLRKHSVTPDEDLIEELFHTVFLSLIENKYKKLRQFQWKCKLSTWLHLIAVNMTIDFIRKQRVNELSLDSETEEGVPIVENLQNGTPPVDEVIEQEEEKKIFEQIAKELTPREQLFLKLYYRHKLHTNEIAKILKTTTNNVYQLNSTVRAKLKKKAENIL